MNKLKLKFSVFEKRLAMQVIEQSVDITGSLTKALDFKASNGIVITSNSKPGIYPELNQISIRGGNKNSDLDVVYGRFRTTEEAIDFMNRVKSAVAELFDTINEKEINRLSNLVGEVIELPKCKILLNTIQGSYVFQLISSDFDESPSELVKNGDDLMIGFDPSTGDNLKIILPFKAKEPLTSLINITKLSNDQSKKLIQKIIFNLSGISSHTQLDNCDCDKRYPNYYLHSS